MQNHPPKRCQSSNKGTFQRNQTIGGFESMSIMRKRQVKAEDSTSAEIFYSMAA